MVTQRLALILSVLSTSFCTDHGLQTGVGDKVVSDGSSSGESYEARSVSDPNSGEVKSLSSAGLSLDGKDRPSELKGKVSPSTPLVPASGLGICDIKVPSCGPTLVVHFPTDPLFQEGSGGPTEPIEVSGILEFFQMSDCLRSYVQRSRDLRSSYRSGCIEVEQGIAPLKDGDSISLSLGDYYIRVRGYDGAPYTHFLLAHKANADQKDLFIEQLEAPEIDEISAAVP